MVLVIGQMLAWFRKNFMVEKKISPVNNLNIYITFTRTVL